MWEHFSAYHLDRLDALARQLAGTRRVVGIEVATGSHTYAWPPVIGEGLFQRVTLQPGGMAEDVPWRVKLAGLIRTVRRTGAAHVFLCNQEQPEILAAAPMLRAMGRRVFAMTDAKFDDSPRRVAKEVAKQAVLRCYNGAVVAGARHQDYYRFLGLPAGWAVPGYDTVSIERIRREAATPPAPAGVPFAERDILVVARFVPKKNVDVAIRAYAALRRARPGETRRLVLCGAGPLEAELRALVAELAVPDVVFAGFLDSAGVSRALGRALMLLVPSTGEQWGLVVNEAVAMGVPVLVSENVGARDSLVRSGVNGFMVEPGNPEGLAVLMGVLAADQALWTRMAEASLVLAPRGDVGRFVDGVQALIGN